MVEQRLEGTLATGDSLWTGTTTELPCGRCHGDSKDRVGLDWGLPFSSLEYEP